MSKRVGHNPGFLNLDDPVQHKIWLGLEENRRLSNKALNFTQEEKVVIVKHTGKCLRKAYELFFEIDETERSDIFLDGKQIRLKNNETDLKEVFNYAFDELEGKHDISLASVVGHNISEDNLNCIMHRFHLALLFTKMREWEASKEQTNIRCLNEWMISRNEDFINLNKFSEFALNFFLSNLN